MAKTNVASNKNITRLQRTISQLAEAAQLRSAGTGQESWLAQNYFRFREGGRVLPFSSLLYCLLNIHILKFTLLPSYLISNPPYFYLLFEISHFSGHQEVQTTLPALLIGVLGFVAVNFVHRKLHQGDEHH